MKRILIAILATAFSGPLLAESLWRKGGVDDHAMYADRRANNVGDILLILVDETTSVTGAVNKSSSQSSTSSSGISSFFFRGSNMLSHNGAMPEIEHGASKSFGGSGSFSNTQRALSQAAVMIVDVLPNGNLIVEGARKIEVSGESQVAILRGIVRADDVSSENSVLSSRIANAEVEIVTKGAIGESQKRGFFMRVFDMINLF